MQYEYKIERNLTLEDLNNFGAMRWELVTVILDGMQNCKYYFKRELTR